MALSEEAKAARREYMKQWRNKPENKEKMNSYMKKWRSKPENKEKIKQYQEDHWKRKAEEMKV